MTPRVPIVSLKPQNLIYCVFGFAILVFLNLLLRPPRPELLHPTPNGEVPPLFLDLGQYTNTSAYDLNFNNKRFLNPKDLERRTDDLGPIIHYTLIHNKTAIYDEELRRNNFHLTLYRYLAIRSSYIRLRPVAIYLHTNVMPPPTPYWHLIKPMISKVIIWDDVDSIYNQEVRFEEHKADFLRLNALNKYGGIYLDTDVFGLRELDDHYYRVLNSDLKIVMGNEMPRLVCNAVIIAERNNTIIDEWLNNYRTSFVKDSWFKNSIQFAYELSQKYPADVHAVPLREFYFPIDPNAPILFGNINWYNRQFNFDHNRVVHLWNSQNDYRIGITNAHTIIHENTSLNRILRPLLPNPFFSFIVKSKSVNAKYVIAQQSFPLYEIVESDGEVRGIWQIYVEDSDLFDSQYLEHVLDLMRDAKDLNMTIVTSNPQKDVRFVFDGSKVIFN